MTTGTISGLPVSREPYRLQIFDLLPFADSLADQQKDSVAVLDLFREARQPIGACQQRLGGEKQIRIGPLRPDLVGDGLGYSSVNL